MMKYGFEREYFVRKDGQLCLAPTDLPMDECGYLVEARGEPFENPMEAACNLLAKEYLLAMQAAKKGFQLVLMSHVKLDAELKRQAIRQFGKNPMPHDRGSMYGRDYRANDTWARAGLHVHFSDYREVKQTWESCKECHHRSEAVTNVPQMIDMPKIIYKLDKEFTNEIRAAHRLPGLYEMKPHGFEYRSLPTTTDPRVVAAVLRDAQFTQPSLEISERERLDVGNVHLAA